MFGTFRLMLALMVVYSHFAGGGLGGPVAVFGFFCLSGYLMTKIVNESYSDGVAGFLRYLCNRALRIYPAYYAAIVFAAAVLLLWPAEARTAAGWYRFPHDWLQTLSIIGLQPRSPILLVPAWSLHVEIIHFILIGAVLGRSRLLTSLWFFCSLAILAVAILRGVSFDWLYLLALRILGGLRDRRHGLSVSRETAGLLADAGTNGLLHAHLVRLEDAP